MYLLLTKLKRIGSADEGASLVEYALLIALISIVALLAVRFFGTELSTSYSDISQSIANA